MIDESITQKLSELFELYKSGTLTKEEYESLKSTVINQGETRPEKEKGQNKEPEIKLEKEVQESHPVTDSPATEARKISGKRPVITAIISFIVICLAVLAVVFLRPAIARHNSDNKNKQTEAQVVDADGNSYYTVTIGTQTWMAENLKTTKFNDGSAIPIATDSAQWAALSSPACCWYNNDEISNKNAYGALYNWYTVSTNKLCPSGWHVPTDEEWSTLTEFLSNNGYGYEGGSNDIAKSLAGTNGWLADGIAGNVGNDQATNNRSGFTALPGGYRFNDGSFLCIGSHSKWWSSTEASNTSAHIRFINHNSNIVSSYANRKRNGFSVRCLQDVSGSVTNLPPNNTGAVSVSSAWDEEYAAKIIMSELEKWTEWPFSESFTSEELNHEVLKTMDFELDSKDLKVVIAYTILEGHCPPYCDGVISVFEFENKAGWRLNRKAIGFDKLTAEGHFEIYKMSASEYGILIKNLFSSGKWGTSKSIRLYAFANDKLTSTLGWYREDIDTVFSAKVLKTIRDGQSYVMLEEKAKPDESDTIVTQTVYKFNGTEYEKFTGYLTDPSLTSISRFYDINTVKDRESGICPTCHGTGIQICTLCGGRGVNNMGIECGCIRQYKSEKAAGHSPSHPPMQWTCTSCRGTGKYSR